MSKLDTKLKIAIQKSGRLHERCVRFIESCGIKFPKNKSVLKAEAHNFPMQFLFLRDDDIPACVAEGVADVGMVGLNEVEETAENVDIVKRLGFSKCRMSLAVPKNMEYNGLQDLSGKTIATSYPRILQNYLKENQVEARVHQISGSVEIAPSVGMADAVFDIVSSGSTLMSNGLKEIKPTVLKSEAVLIANRNLDTEQQAILDKLTFRMDALLEAQNFKYLMFNFPTTSKEEIVNIIPGLKSPTIVPLSNSSWSALHSVVEEDVFWDKIDNLKSAGAEDIIVLPIEKIIR